MRASLFATIRTARTIRYSGFPDTRPVIAYLTNIVECKQDGFAKYSSHNCADVYFEVTCLKLPSKTEGTCIPLSSLRSENMTINLKVIEIEKRNEKDI